MKHLLILTSLLISALAAAQQPLDSIKIYKAEPFVFIDVFSSGSKHIVVGSIESRSVSESLVHLQFVNGDKVWIEYQGNYISCIRHTTKKYKKEFCRLKNLVQ